MSIPTFGVYTPENDRELTIPSPESKRDLFEELMEGFSELAQLRESFNQAVGVNTLAEYLEVKYEGPEVSGK